MHFHLPKPLHGWREFAGEVGIIVLGVLIALGFEQVVHKIHDHSLAAETRADLHSEIEAGIGRMVSRQRSEACIERRLGEIET
jgi:hypothetical protein